MGSSEYEMHQLRDRYDHWAWMCAAHTICLLFTIFVMNWTLSTSAFVKAFRFSFPLSRSWSVEKHGIPSSFSDAILYDICSFQWCCFIGITRRSTSFPRFLVKSYPHGPEVSLLAFVHPMDYPYHIKKPNVLCPERPFSLWTGDYWSRFHLVSTVHICVVARI